uniref:ANK_REP_REGION domain-containing protein n=2 Tax=Caenorhabditis tropicalis TaxID=1561998 RepID=A0A1I7UDX0_9PELO
MKFYILMMSFFLIAQCDLHNHQFEVENSLDRMKRDAPPIKSKAAVVVEQHMKLARILNAIYLQMQLANDKIDDFDVVAGIWEVDRSAIEKLVSLKVEALDGSLNSLEQMVNEFPNDLLRIGDMEEISKKMDSVKEITPEKREALRFAMKNDSVPGFLEKDDFPKWNFTVNLADIVLEKLEEVKNMTVDKFKRSIITDLKTSMTNVADVLIDVNEWSKGINEMQQKMTGRLVEGYQAAIEVQNKLNDLKELPKLLVDIGNVLPNLQQLKNIQKVSSIQEQSRHLFNALLQLHQLSNKSLAPAFSSNFDITTVKENLRDKGIMLLLRGGQDLGPLESYLGDISSTAKTFTPVNQNTETLMSYALIDQLDIVSQLIDGISKLQSYSNPLNFTSLPLCSESLSLEKEVGQSELQTLAQDLNLLLSVIPTILETLKNVEAIREDVNNFRSKLENIKNKDDFEKWINENETEKVQEALEAANDLFEGIIQTQDVADAIGRLPSQKNQIFSIQQRIGGFSILKKECESLFDFDIEPFKAFNDLPDTIQRMKEEKTIQMIKPLVGTIPKLREDLEKLKRTKSPATTVASVTKGTGSQKSKRSADDGKKFECQNPQDLLDVAISVRGLEIMYLIFQYNNLLDTVIQQGALAGNSIATIKNPSNKAELEKIWKNFGLMKTKLEAVKSNNQRLVDTVTSSGQETSLEDIGLVYRNLASLNPSERIFLRDLRLSMRLFEQQNKTLMDSLEKLEKPLATDWQMTHASFKRVPTAMQNLKKDFDKFFEVETGIWVTIKQNPLKASGIGGVVVLLLIGIGSFSFYWKYIHDPEMSEDPPVDTTPFMPNREALENHLDYMQFQDSRFEINQRGIEGNTKLLEAFKQKDFEEMRRLASEGAIIDAVCGKHSRTLLMEAAIAKDSARCDALLKVNASIHIWDCDSKRFKEFATEGDILSKLKNWEEEREGFVRYLPSKEPRPWKILVLKKGTFPLWKRKKLPHRIKACTKWGWTGEDLNQYTTIILPWKYIKGKTDKDNEVLMLDDSEDLLKWKLVGCAACLLTVQFFERLYNAFGYPNEVQEILQTDYRNWLEQEWIDNWDVYTCVDFEFLPECIARFYLLPTNNDVVPLAYQIEGKGGKGYLKAQKAEAKRLKKMKKKQESTTSSVASTSKQGNTTSTGSSMTT